MCDIKKNNTLLRRINLLNTSTIHVYLPIILPRYYNIIKIFYRMY